MKNCKLELASGGQTQVDFKIQGDIIEGDSLSLLLFVIAMMPLNYIQRKCKRGENFIVYQEKINHVMYLDDIKISTMNEKNLRTNY